MKYLTIMLVLGLSAPASATDFSGAFGRNTSCQSVIGNWVDAYDSCPMLGNGAGPRSESGDHVGEPPAPEPPKCEPKETKES
jgi:hypothetical protein